jgi:NTP pyrophosphatase (non-canonical NTP hydrolase)
MNTTRIVEHTETFEDLKEQVLVWSKNKGILDNSDLKTQTLKMVSEVGEACDNVARMDLDALEDDLGDILVTLINVAEFAGKDLNQCLFDALGVITKRTGKMVDGTFVKDV